MHIIFCFQKKKKIGLAFLHTKGYLPMTKKGQLFTLICECRKQDAAVFVAPIMFAVQMNDFISFV